MDVESSQKYKYLFSNIFAFFCGSFGTKIIGFVMVPLYTNLLSPKEYGEIDLILSMAGLIAPFIAVGVHEGVMRFCLTKGANRQLILSIGLRVFVGSSALCALALPLLSRIPIVCDNTVFIYLYCVFQEMLSIVLYYIRGKDNTKLYAFLGFVSALLIAVLNIIFIVLFRWGVQGYKISMLIAPLITLIIASKMGNVTHEYTLKLWDKTLAIDMMKFSAVLLPNALLWWCIDVSDRIFVSYMCGTSSNGIYAVSYKIPTLINVVSTIVMQSWQMLAIGEHEFGERKKAEEFRSQLYKFMIFIIGMATLGMLLLNRFLLSIYVGEKYQSAWMYSPPLLVAFFCGAIGNFWGAFYIAEKRMNIYLLSSVVGAAANILLNYILILHMGIIGAALSTAIGYACVMLIRMLGIKNQMNLKAVNKQFLSVSLCIVAGAGIAYLPDTIMWPVGILNISILGLINIDSIKEFVTLIFHTLKYKKV